MSCLPTLAIEQVVSANDGAVPDFPSTGTRKHSAAIPHTLRRTSSRSGMEVQLEDPA